MSHRTYAEIADSFELWQEYVDPDATTNEEEFDAMGYAGRMALMVETYGPEPERVPTVDEILAETSIGCGLHRWAVEGGSITVNTTLMRQLLEEVYDPNMPSWMAFVDAEEIAE